MERVVPNGAARRAAQPRKRESVIAVDGGLYVVRLGDRVKLELLACADQGIALFVDIDRLVFIELPVLGSA